MSRNVDVVSRQCTIMNPNLKLYYNLSSARLARQVHSLGYPFAGSSTYSQTQRQTSNERSPLLEIRRQKVDHPIPQGIHIGRLLVTSDGVLCVEEVLETGCHSSPIDTDDGG